MRLGVSLAVSFSAACGYILASSNIDVKILHVFLGVFLMAGGASALNQLQEYKTDALMHRTKNRPIPTRRISSATALLISVILSLSGFLILYFKCGSVSATLGLLNMIWYNGFYTYLKKKTAFAVVPGSLTGVTPILIGWTAAHASMWNPGIVLISFFIYMWQIPHFWLLHLKYSEDYEKAGLGSLKRLFSFDQIKRIIFSWIVATSTASLLFIYFDIIKSALAIFAFLLFNLWLVIFLYKSLFQSTNLFEYKKAFIGINAFMLVVMLTLIFESLF